MPVYTVLTIETALAYAAEVAPECTIVSAEVVRHHFAPLIWVHMTYASGRKCRMDCWLEGGRVYGEY